MLEGCVILWQSLTVSQYVLLCCVVLCVSYSNDDGISHACRVARTPGLPLGTRAGTRTEVPAGVHE